MAGFRAMSRGQRAQRAVELSQVVEAFTIAGIRKRHPDHDEDQVVHALRRLRFGDSLTREAWPHLPLVAP